jgi:hypothetical protein
MDARGFGRRTPGKNPLLARGASLVSVCVLAIASYLLLSASEPRWVTWLLLGSGVLGIGLAVRLSSPQSKRTIFNRQPFGVFDFTLVCISVLLVLTAWAGWVR